jgi:parallel beta-helix repeat protein
MTRIFYLTFVCLALSFESNSQTTKYIAPWGSDNISSGSNTQPYRSIWYANNVNSGPAMLIFKIRPGIYFEIQNTNLVGNRILMKDSTGDVIIDASIRDSAISFKYMLGIVDVNNVTIDNIYFRNCIGQGVKGIYVLGASKNIEIRNCRFRNIGWINRNLKRRPPDNDFRVANAIRVQGTRNDSIYNIRIISNFIDSCATGWGEVVTLTGNVSNFLIDSNIISRVSNIGIEIAGNYDTSGYVPNLLLNQTRNGTISNNIVSYCMSGRAVSAGIYLDGSLNCLVTSNRVYKSGVGISIGAEEPIRTAAVGKHRLRNNIIDSNSIVGIFIGSSRPGNVLKKSYVNGNTIFKNTTAEFINGVDSIGITDAVLKPVTQIANETKGSVGFFNSDSTTFQNNIIETLNGRNAIVGMTGSTSTNFKLNYNLYYRDHVTDFYTFPMPGHNFNGNIYSGVVFPNIPDFTNATQQDSNSVFGNPKFINTSVPDFRLDTCSAAIDRGNPVYDANLFGNLDFMGNPRRYNNGIIDAGAYEFQAINLPCIFTIISAMPQCSGTISGIKINWTKSNNANSYNIFLTSNPGVPLNSVPILDTFFIHSPLVSNSVYTYSVRAVNASGIRNSVNNLTDTAPVCPTGGFILNALVPKCNGLQTQIQLTWSASANASAYKIYRGAGGPDSYYFNVGNVLAFTDTVTYGIAYSYRVRAVNSIDSSFNTNGIINGTNKICLTGPFTLDNLIAQCNGNLSLIIIKTSSSVNATSYSIYRDIGNINPVSFYKNIIVPVSSVLNFTDTVSPSVTYSYKIRAKNDIDSSFNSNGYLTRTATNCITNVFYINNNLLEVKLFPNPTTGDIFLNMNGASSFNLKVIQLLNDEGKIISNILVNTRNTNFTKSIHTDNLASGTYYIKLYIDNKIAPILSFIKL